MEKQHLIIIKDTETEESIVNSRRICNFENLMVTTISLDELYKDPERINKVLFKDFETKVHFN